MQRISIDCKNDILLDKASFEEIFKKNYCIVKIGTQLIGATPKFELLTEFEINFMGFLCISILLSEILKPHLTIIMTQWQR